MVSINGAQLDLKKVAIAGAASLAVLAAGYLALGRKSARREEVKSSGASSARSNNGSGDWCVAHQNINIAEFLSVLIYLTEECGKVIRQVEESGDLKT